MPNWCENKIEIFGSAEAIEQLVALVKSPDSDFDFNRLIPYPEEYAVGDVDGKAVGYNSGGYDWCIRNWGTKWNACEPSVIVTENTVEIYFDTAWSPSLEVTEKLVSLFPDVTIKHTYEEGGMDFSGYVLYKNGEIVESEEGDYDVFPVHEHEHCEDEYEEREEEA